MKGILLFIGLLSFSSFGSDFTWSNRVPFKYEMSWELSKSLKSDTYLLNVDKINCLKEGNGVQGEYDYDCESELSVLLNGVKRTLQISFDIIELENRQGIFIK